MQRNKWSACLLLLMLVFVPHTMYSQVSDISILRHINLGRDKSLDPSFVFITNSVTPVIIATPVLLCTAGFIKKDSTLKRNAFYIGETMIVSAFVSSALKYSVKRTRPFITYPDLEPQTPAGSYSFPSGHTSAAFALATSATIAFPKWYVTVPAFAWAVAVGYSRMDLGVHYPTDVLAGAITGSGSAYITYKLNKWVNKKRKTNKVKSSN